MSLFKPQMDVDNLQPFEQFCNDVNKNAPTYIYDTGMTFVALTKPIARARPIIPNAEQEIAYATRVSSALQGKTDLKADLKLLASCFARGEMSVFQTVNFAVEFRTSREVFRQFMRHWSIHVRDILDVQELSQRYSKINIKSEDKKNVNFYRKYFRFHVKNDRQSSFMPGAIDIFKTCDEIKSGTKDLEIIVPEKSKNKTYNSLQEKYYQAQVDKFKECYDTYEDLISDGLVKESARTFLPEGMTLTDVYANGTVRSWITYINTRLHMETGTPQYEHLQLAEAINDEFKKKFPNLHEVLWPQNKPNSDKN